MQQNPAPYQKMLFVCTNRRENGEACCADRGAEPILAALKERIKARGLARKIRACKSGCHDMCPKGPSVMLYPDNVWYSGVGIDDVDRILAEAARGME